MAFQADDIYTSSGSVSLQNAWVPHVTKFDTSTFYNWEQDNEPLYDLEDRTYELWEQQGYPTSSVPGLALVVSGNADTASLQANPNIFTTVSACIAAITKVVRFPVLIEIASSGDLGNLELHNFRIEEGGSIEIINRNAIKLYGATNSCVLNTYPGEPQYNESLKIIETVSSLDLSSHMSGDSSSVILDTQVQEFNTPYSFMHGRHVRREGSLAYSEQEDFTVDSGDEGDLLGLPIFAGGLVDVFNRKSYEDSFTDETTSLSYDLSARSQYSSDLLFRNPVRDVTQGLDPIIGMVYFNRFNSISVKNCDGPIYIRHFYADGGRTVSEGIDVGIHILNSDIVLENCSAAKCLDAGFRFNNSKVVLSRSAFSYRNYDIESTTVRVEDTGIGFDLINSDVTLSANIEAGNGNYDRDASGTDIIFCASRNDIGFKLTNSTLRGGFGRLDITDPETGGVTISELNSSVGFELDNSVVDLDGLLDVYANDIGIRANNSKVNFTDLTVEANNSAGVDSRNSIFTLDSKDNTLVSVGQGQTVRHQLDFRDNGQHIKLENSSKFGFKHTTAMPSKFGGTIFKDAHGTITWGGLPTGNKPAISVESGSKAEFIHAVIEARKSAEIEASPTYGLAARADSNSEISFFGTGSGCTMVLGGDADYPYHAALYGGHNSKINLHGPTLIARGGINVLVEDNSQLTISPPRTENGSMPDVSAFSLEDTKNHTSVELHSHRACLVANRDSTINLEDLGHFANFWKNTTNGQLLLAEATDYNNGNTFDTSAYTKFGSLQFYPNPFSDESPNNSADGKVFNLSSIIGDTTAFPVFSVGAGDQNKFLVGDYGSPDYASLSSVSYGGVCVRAVGDSNVNVRNVHFPVGVNDSPLDGHYYNASSDECHRIMIWNIADESKLHATYTSVSGSFPLDVGYHGPSAFYMDGANLAISSAPADTPDTGTLSVHDQFGAGSAVHQYPADYLVNDPFDRSVSGADVPTGTYLYGTDGTFNNQGVFRIYFSVDSAAKLLAQNGIVGPAYQTFAQGYNCSGDLSALTPEGVTSVSGAYPQLLKFDGTTLTTSGFYYCKEFVEDNPTQVLLDEAGSNTFANAKNASTGQSGKPKKVTIHRSRLGDSTTGDNRGSESFEGDQTHGQFRSATLFDLERDV